MESTLRFGYFIKLSQWLGIIFLLVSTITILNIESLGKIILPSAANSKDFIRELSWTVWAIPLLALNAVSRVFLQAENRFTLLGLENVLFNLCIILGIMLFAKNPSLHLITLAVLIGAGFRWALQFIQIWRLYQRNLTGYQTAIQLSDLHRYNLALVTGLLLQLLPIYGRSIASAFEREGALAIYNYAYKFIEFPMALGISVISTLVFPKLAEIAVKGHGEEHSELIRKSQTLIISLCLPATILVPLLLLYLSEIPSSFKQIPPEDLSKIFIAIAIGFVVFLVRGLTELYTVILNSLGDVKHPMYATIASSTVGLVAIFFLTKYYGILGSFWGLNLSFIVTFLLSIWFLKTKHGIQVIQHVLTSGNIKTGLLTIFLGIIFWISSKFLNTSAALICWLLILLGLYLGTLGKQLISKVRR